MIEFINSVLWSAMLLYLLAGAGIYFTLRTRFIQLRQFSHIFSLLKRSRCAESGTLSAFQSLCLTLASRISTSNLTGVAIAIVVGGPGATFWMWIMALLGMATAMIESTLSQLYKTRDATGRFRGGPAWYMEKGLGMRWMAILFSIMLIITFGFLLNALQAHAIASTLSLTFETNILSVAVPLTLLTAVFICLPINKLARFSEYLVPFMIVAYLLLACGVVVQNIERLPEIMVLIFKSAFGLQAAVGGVIGFTTAQALAQGLHLGSFSHESGMGSAPNIDGQASVKPLHPATQGYLQMLGVLVDTWVICSSTVMIIMASGALDFPVNSLNGFTLIQQALLSAFGPSASPLLAATVFCFAFSSIYANYLYAENGLAYLLPARPAAVLVLRLAVLGMILVGSFSHHGTLWKLAETAFSLMAVMNLTAILLLSNTALAVIRDYQHQRRLGKLPVFSLTRHPELKMQLRTGIWDKPHEP